MNNCLFHIIIGLSIFFLINIPTVGNPAGELSAIKQGYTIESTYQKYSKRYPEISRPNLNIPDHINFVKDQVFKSINNIELRLDIYSKKSLKITSSTQLIILIHGGGWRIGDKSLMQPLAVGLANKGYIVATPNYRLSGQAIFPAALNDLYDAVNWLISNESLKELNDKNIVLAGTSAGGQLAALLAYSGGNVLYQNDKTPEFTVNALINIDGLSDFTSPEALPFENDPTKTVTSASAWLGGRFEDIPKIWQAASPFYYISEKSPKTLFINSSMLRFSAGKTAATKKLTEFNIFSHVEFVENSPHSFWLLNPWIDPTVINIDSFLKQK